jgi:hypothetical protein
MGAKMRSTSNVAILPSNLGQPSWTSLISAFLARLKARDRKRLFRVSLVNYLINSRVPMSLLFNYLNLFRPSIRESSPKKMANISTTQLLLLLLEAETPRTGMS